MESILQAVSVQGVGGFTFGGTCDGRQGWQRDVGFSACGSTAVQGPGAAWTLRIGPAGVGRQLCREPGQRVDTGVRRCATASCPRSVRQATTFDPIDPVPPITTDLHVLLFVSVEGISPGSSLGRRRVAAVMILLPSCGLFPCG